MEKLNLLGSQPFESARLKLRKFRISDASAMFKNWASSENVTKYLSWEPHPCEDATREYLAFVVKESNNLDNFHWALEDKESGEIIGDINAVKVDKEKSEVLLGWVLGEKWWNKGYMTEAAEAVIAYLIFVIGFDKVKASHVKENIGSGKVMEKVGMAKVGTHKKELKGVEREFIDYQITKAEWLALNLRLRGAMQ